MLYKKYGNETLPIVLCAVSFTIVRIDVNQSRTQLQGNQKQWEKCNNSAAELTGEIRQWQKGVEEGRCLRRDF